MCRQGIELEGNAPFRGTGPGSKRWRARVIGLSACSGREAAPGGFPDGTPRAQDNSSPLQGSSARACLSAGRGCLHFARSIDSALVVALTYIWARSEDGEGSLFPGFVLGCAVPQQAASLSWWTGFVLGFRRNDRSRCPGMEGMGVCATRFQQALSTPHAYLGAPSPEAVSLAPPKLVAMGIFVREEVDWEGFPRLA